VTNLTITAPEQGVQATQKLTGSFAIFCDIGQKLHQFGISTGVSTHPLPGLGITCDGRKGLTQLSEDRRHVVGIRL